MPDVRKRKVLIKEHSPKSGEVLRNLNVKIPSSLLMKLRIKAQHKNKYVKNYVLDIIEKDVKNVEVNVS